MVWTYFLPPLVMFALSCEDQENSPKLTDGASDSFKFSILSH